MILNSFGSILNQHQICSIETVASLYCVECRQIRSPTMMKIDIHQRSSYRVRSNVYRHDNIVIIGIHCIDTICFNAHFRTKIAKHSADRCRSTNKADQFRTFPKKVFSMKTFFDFVAYSSAYRLVYFRQVDTPLSSFECSFGCNFRCSFRVFFAPKTDNFA